MKSYGGVTKAYVTQVANWLHNFFTTMSQRSYKFITIKIKEVRVVLSGPGPAVKISRGRAIFEPGLKFAAKTRPRVSISAGGGGHWFQGGA